MGSYLIRRLIQSVIAIWGVSTIVFLILRLSGDPALVMLPPGGTPEDLARLRTQLGFDRPLPVQYLDFLWGVVRGDFGHSFYQSQPAMELVLQRFPATLQLAIAAMVIALIVGVTAGVISARYRNSWWDRVTMLVALIGQAMPSFWLGILMVLVFSVWLRWFPPTGRGSLEQMILPSVTLGLVSMATIARMTRSAMLEVLGQDYVRTARSKGLAEQTVLYRHALRNAALPVVTVAALELSLVLGGAVIVETIFAWPGVGRLAVDSIAARDFPVVQAVVVFVSTLYIAINLVTDLAYGVLDPRIRLH